MGILSDRMWDPIHYPCRTVIYSEWVKEFIGNQSENIISRLFGTFKLSPSQLEAVTKAINESNKELAGEKLL